MAEPERSRPAPERRAARLDDPALWPGANRARHGARPSAGVVFGQNRFAILMTFLAALAIGAIVSLTTGSWWFLLLALGVHALGTLAMVALVLAMREQQEHLPPGAAVERAREEVHERP